MRRALLFTGVALGAAIGSSLILPAAPVTQALPFNHAKHAALTCAGCHAGIQTTQRAGFPPHEVCAKCHAAAPAGVAPADWDQLQALGVRFWKPVTRLPEHVMFSHRRHVALASLACASCHADIGERTAPPTRMPRRLVMDTCLTCHRAEGASEDCAGCHR
jgi:hypothetical protein